MIKVIGHWTKNIEQWEFWWPQIDVPNIEDRSEVSIYTL